jgi:hypothetical protein
VTWPPLDGHRGQLAAEGDTAMLRVVAHHPAVDGEISVHEHVYHPACQRWVPMLAWVYGSHACPPDARG